MPYAFSSALRGYDIRQVDQLLETAERALASGREQDRESAQKALRAAEFPQRLRGYDRAQVDRFIDDLIRKLGATR